MASGSYQQVVGDVIGIDKSTVSRCVAKFCQGLVDKKHLFIHIPRTEVEKTRTKGNFFDIGGFPSTIAIIDSFYVPIIAPSHDEDNYVNRKGWHSINVQGMTDADNKFINVVAKWPGSTHDSFIFRTSSIHTHLEVNNTRIEHGLVLGDSGYGLSRF